VVELAEQADADGHQEGADAEQAPDGGIGPVDLKRALSILVEHGYDGPLSLEYEGNGGDPWAKSLAVLDLARSVLNG
jgi:sugar phosphate isomerase/epimerase